MFESTADFRSAFVRPREASLCLNPVRSKRFFTSIWVYFGAFLHVCPELVWANSTLACPELVLAKRRVSFEKTRWIVTRPRTQTVIYI